MRLRAAIVDDGVLRLLPGEVVYHTVDGVFNLTSESGALGAIIITNIRLVWYSVLNEAFNVSLPYLQIGTIVVRESKFGLAVIVETRATSSSDAAASRNAGATESGNSSSAHTPYVLGFRIDPSEKLQLIVKELKSCHEVYAKNPVFGVDYCMPTNVTALTEAATRAAAAAASDEQLMFDVLRQGTSSRLEAKADKSVNAVSANGEEMRARRYAQRDTDAVFDERGNGEAEANEDDGDNPDSLRARPVIYSEELGLAIQKPPAGVTLHDLWMVPT